MFTLDTAVGHAFSTLALQGLSAHGTVLLFFTLLVFVAFVWDRLPIASVCLAILVFLPLLFLAFPAEADGDPLLPTRFFAGFGHPALVAICALMVLGHGLVATGALEPLARQLSGLVAKRPTLALAVVLLGAIGISGFVNDTPVVVLLIPLLLAATQRAKVSPAGVLMPMNFAVLIGGMSTTIGTSTNLIVASMAQNLGLPRMGILHFYDIVMMAAVPALLYLWLVAPRLLSSVPAPDDIGSQEAFDAELIIEAGSEFEGKELREAVAATKGHMRVVELRSEHGGARSKLPTMRMRAGDRLLVQDTVANLKEYERLIGASLHGLDLDEPQNKKDDAKQTGSRPDANGDQNGDESGDGKKDAKEKHAPDAIVAQLVTTPQSILVGRTIRQQYLAHRYGLAVVGLRPVHTFVAPAQREVADRRVAAGDVLLVQGTAEALQDAQRDGVGLLLDARHVLPRQNKSLIALLTMAAVVLLSATKVLPIEVAALAGVFTLLVSGALNWREASSALSVRVVMLVAASLALGDALSVTGATGWLAGQLVEIAGDMRPRWILVLVMGLMGLLTNFVSNNAAAAIGTPLAVELARRMGAAPEPFVLAVLFGCNLCYVTPMGYQSNLLVMNAGGYRFADFVRVGSPLFLLFGASLSAMLIWRYGL